MLRTTPMKNSPFLLENVANITARQAGFNLLEVLIALIVLAVGLLGLAALQNMGLRLSHQSYERTQAVLLVEEMIDRMRANAAGVLANDYLLAETSTPPAAGTDCANSFCNSSAMAAYDLNQWISTISGTATAINPGVTRPALVAGTGAVVAVGGSLFDVTVTWQEQDTLQTQTVRVHLP